LIFFLVFVSLDFEVGEKRQLRRVDHRPVWGEFIKNWNAEEQWQI